MLVAASGCNQGTKAPKRCAFVSVQDGCKAHCSTFTAQPDGSAQVCTKQLVITRASKNNILQNDTHQKQTVSLSKPVCFTVRGDAIADADATERMTKMCNSKPTP